MSVNPSSLPPVAGSAPRVGRLRMSVRLLHGFGVVLLGVVLASAVFPLSSPARRRALVRWWAKRFVTALGVRVQVHGAWPAAPGRYLLASNHISWLDIFVIHSVYPVRFVSKAEVRHWPVAGFLAKQSGTLFLDRTRKRDTKDIGAEMLAVLEDGEALGIYPEGTTSDGSVLLPFFSPLLQPAVNGLASVVPTGLRYSYRHSGERNTALAFIGEQTFLDSVLITARQPGVLVEVRFGTPIPSVGQHRRELTQQVERAVAELLQVPVVARTLRPGERPQEGSPG